VTAGHDGATDRPTTGEGGGPDPGRAQTRGSVLLLLGRVAAMLLTVTTQIVLVRALSKSDFGAFAFALAITSGCRVLLSLGQGKSLSRHLAAYDEQSDHARLFGTMILTGLTVIGMSVVVLTALLVMSGSLGRSFLDSAEAVDVLVVLIFLAPVEACDEVFLSIFAVFARARSIFVRRYLLTPGLRLAVVLGVAVGGGGATHLALGYVGTSVVGVVFYAVLLKGVLRERDLLGRVRLREIVLPVREVFSFSLPLLSNELVYLSLNTGSVLVLAWFATASEVADYRAAFPAARLNQFVYTAFATLYLPMATRYFARGQLDRLRADHWQTAMLLAVFTFPVCAMTLPFAPVTTTALLGDRYAEAAGVMAVLSAGYYLSTCFGFNVLALQVAGRVRYLLGVNVVVALVNLGLSLLLVQELGALGVAAANGVMLVLQNLLYQWAVRGELRTTFVDRASRRGYAGILVALAGLALVQLLLDPSLLQALVLAAATSLAVLRANRFLLRLDQTFPEVARIPLIHRLVRSTAAEVR
jgi:O-antigen/teichoic acid export membrane protein